MGKRTKKIVIGILGSLILMLLIAYLPPETQMMSRQAWQYVGCFAFMLVLLLTGIFPGWASVLATMIPMLLFKIGTVETLTAQFASPTIWMIIGAILMSVGISNSGVLKRMTLWLLKMFPETYKGQVTAMTLAGIATTPLVASAAAKCAIMAPLIGQVCEAVGVEPNSRAARGLWFSNFMCTHILGIAFLTGSVFAHIMIGFMTDLSFTWLSWFKCTFVWYIVLIVLNYFYCVVLCKPKEEIKRSNASMKEQYQTLGPLKLAEKQTLVILSIAVILWITQSYHGLSAGFVAIGAALAFYCCGLLSEAEISSKGHWTLILFLGGILGIASFMNSTGVSAMLASVLGPVLSPLIRNPYIFVPVLCIATYILRYVIVSNAGMVAIVLAIFGPLLESNGISIFIPVFVTYVSTINWNTAYINPSVVGFVAMTGEKSINFDCAKKASYAYMVMNLIAIMASIPLWSAIGLC